MPEPTLGELPKVKFVTVGETPLYLTLPDGTAQSVTLKSATKRGSDGVDNAVLLVRQASRRKDENEYIKPLDNVNEFEQVEWDKVGGIKYTDDKGEHIITKDQLSLEKPADPEPPANIADGTSPRQVLEKITGVPTLTIVGLKAYEVRAHDLADKSMQLPKSETKDFLKKMVEIKRTIWKQSLGHTYFHEKARQYYMDMLKTAQSPFASESIKMAEAAGQKRYNELLENSSFLSRAGTKVTEYLKSNLGMRTMVQRFALEEIGSMREAGQIKEMASFEREASATRKRFEQDFDNQDNFIRKNLGEKLELADEGVAADIRNLVRKYATGEISSKADFDTATRELYETKLKSARPDVFAKAELYSSSLFDVAETLRTRASHDAGLANIDQELQSMQVRLGMGVMGEATQLEPTAVNKVVTWLEKHDIVFNKLTVSSGVALALTLGAIPKSLVSSQARLLGGFGGGIAAGAVFGGIREYRQLQREYLTHMREREAGLTFSPDSPRRAWMERFYLSQRSTDELLKGLASGDEQTKLATLADAMARKNLSAREKNRYGLIQFSGLENIESERSALDLAIDQAEQGVGDKTFLADLVSAQTQILSEGARALDGLDDPVKRTLGLLSQYNPEVDIVKKRFTIFGADYKTGEQATGMEEILSEFRKAAVKESVRKGLEVGLSGAIIGAGIHEGLRLGFEGAGNAGVHFFRLHNNLSIDGSGNLDTVDTHGKIVHDNLIENLNSHLKNNPDGTFTQETKTFLAEHGLDLSVTRSPVEFSGQTHDLADIPIKVPNELHWVVSDKGRQLVLDAKDGTENLIYTDNGDPSGALTAIRQSELFTYHQEIPGTTTDRFVPPTLTQIPGISGHDASIPLGTKLVESTNGVYSLVDTKGHALLSNIRIDDHGNITNLAQLNNNTDGFELRVDPLKPLQIETETTTNFGDFDKPIVEMGNEKGLHGPWGWLEDPINASKTVDHAVPGTNLAKNLFRGYEENYLSTSNLKDAHGDFLSVYTNYKSLHVGEVYHDLPGALFKDEQLVKLGTLMDESIKMREIDGMSLDAMDQLHRTAYEIGRVGRVATKDEVQMFIDAMGGGTKEETINVFRPIIEQHIVETTAAVPAFITGNNADIVCNIISLPETGTIPEIPWIPLPLVGRRPLEPYEPLVPYAPPEIAPGALFPILPRPDDDRPTPFLHRPAYGSPVAPREQEKGEQYPVEPMYSEEEILAFYTSRLSPDLKANSKAKLGFDKTVQWYLDGQKPEYKQALERINDSIGVPMSDEAQIALCIPVAAHHEGKNIYATLEQYTTQKDADGSLLNPNKYEIILFLNAPAEAERDATHDEVKRFMTDHPEMPVRVATATFPKGSVRYGTYIKYAYDLALLRALKRKNPAERDILIATGDADLLAIDPSYISSNIAFMNGPQGQKLDAGLAAQDLDHNILNAFPTFKSALRFSQYQDAQSREGVPGVTNPHIQTQGRTTIMRGSILAGIGGVNSSSPAGADIELGQMLNYARHNKKWDIPSDEQTIDYNDKTFIETSARRELATYLSGKTLTQTWSKFDEGENVRGKTSEELIAMSKEKPREINAKELERQVNAYRDWQVPMDSQFTRNALTWMGLKEGVDYVIEEDPIEGKRGKQWERRVRFTSDLPGLKERIDNLPSDPPLAS